MTNSNNNYNASYFDWQQKIGKFGGVANRFKFDDYIEKNYKVIDFGCGGGFLLDQLRCKEKIGIEINKVARETAEKFGIQVYSEIDEVSDGWADRIVSNHALEHVPHPLETLTRLRKKLKIGGKFICVVPHETEAGFSYNDNNKHLYTWSPQNLLNLFLESGYKVEKVERIFHSWPRSYLTIQSFFGWRIFHIICKLNSRMLKKGYQTRIVGIRNE
jgi:2-polyprenyl-3-methyl-5-hydroxy-6-metoxy-1,4-benzoquinol methylase